MQPFEHLPDPEEPVPNETPAVNETLEPVNGLAGPSLINEQDVLQGSEVNTAEVACSPDRISAAGLPEPDSEEAEALQLPSATAEPVEAEVVPDHLPETFISEVQPPRVVSRPATEREQTAPFELKLAQFVGVQAETAEEQAAAMELLEETVQGLHAKYAEYVDTVQPTGRPNAFNELVLSCRTPSGIEYGIRVYSVLAKDGPNCIEVESVRTSKVQRYEDDTWVVRRRDYHNATYISDLPYYTSASDRVVRDINKEVGGANLARLKASNPSQLTTAAELEHLREFAEHAAPYVVAARWLEQVFRGRANTPLGPDPEETIKAGHRFDGFIARTLEARGFTNHREKPTTVEMPVIEPHTGRLLDLSFGTRRDDHGDIVPYVRIDMHMDATMAQRMRGQRREEVQADEGSRVRIRLDYTTDRGGFMGSRLGQLLDVRDTVVDSDRLRTLPLDDYEFRLVRNFLRQPTFG